MSIQMVRAVIVLTLVSRVRPRSVVLLRAQRVQQAAQAYPLLFLHRRRHLFSHNLLTQ